VGQLLAEALNVPFIDADDLHPKANVDKMSNGEPLNDDDRKPWLDIVRAAAVKACRAEGSGHETGVVVGCSALKLSYRNLLRGIVESEVEEGEDNTPPHGGHLRTFFGFIDGPKEVLFERMHARKNHFMKAKMLESQLATLEDPRGEEGVFEIRLVDAMDDQVRTALEALAEHDVRPARSAHPAREEVGQGVPVTLGSDKKV